MKTSRKDNPWVAAGLVGALGLNVAVCILIGYYAGRYAADTFGGGSGWLVGGILLGLAAGIFSAVMLVLKVMGGSDG
jgi:Putative F0F1-ATPase subunit (ATPase_gene1).